MFYEEEIVNGVLMYRNIPHGEWHRSNSPRAKAIAAFSEMSQEDREYCLQYLKSKRAQSAAR